MRIRYSPPQLIWDKPDSIGNSLKNSGSRNPYDGRVMSIRMPPLKPNMPAKRPCNQPASAGPKLWNTVSPKRLWGRTAEANPGMRRAQDTVRGATAWTLSPLLTPHPHPPPPSLHLHPPTLQLGVGGLGAALLDNNMVRELYTCSNKVVILCGSGDSRCHHSHTI